MTALRPPVPRLRSPGLLVAGAVLALLTGALAALPKVERSFIVEEGLRAEATLKLAVEAMRGTLTRAETLPALIAERPILAQLLRDPGNEGLAPFVNEQLRQTALALNVSDVYVMDLNGTTVAASSYRSERSFVGQNFAYRPYFTQALVGGDTRFHALGTTSGERGYFVAAPVIDRTEVVGVVAVKANVEEFEDSWTGGGSDLIVVDRNNVIFLSSRPDLRFRTLVPLSEETVAAIGAIRQYPLSRLVRLDSTTEPLSDDLSLIRFADEGARSEYVTSMRLIATAGWRASILTPTGPARTQARVLMAVLVLAILLAGLVAAVYLQRRARLVERLAAQAATQDLLERRVAERTADLDRAIDRLQSEVEERRATEAALRRTQAELVQAGKLAALGQMSAALSHEFNQPLAAVKSYAENAATFLDRGRADEARQNITLISTMADRMAAISKHLRNFARRPMEAVGPVRLAEVLDDALALMAARLAGTEVEVPDPGPDLWVTGGHVRLQQVLVNLLSNALDAMERQPDKRIRIGIETAGQEVRLSVRDSGSGLDPEVIPQIFDPFFSTKGPGKGLGLGLSISYNIVRDFGGVLGAANHPEGGAVFTLTLKRADAPRLAAE